MSFDAWLTVALLSSLFVLLIFTRFPPWAIFWGVLTVAITLRLAPEIVGLYFTGQLSDQFNGLWAGRL